MKILLVKIATNMIEQIILTIVTTGIGYFVGYKKNQNDIEGGRLENLEKSLLIYQHIIDDLSKKVEELTSHIVRLEETIDSLKTENKNLKRQTI
jgi:peptidoglycan hydrolase CwlO-like protein